ncbi:acyl-CoA dehydrogenase family protein [Salisediminibacterium selenitireducens]|uniref:acyl-CoA dehydrogenase family protein n=1 Tax=Salisediminibacterium selenitireducens TaxID=85683 RepID=UPI00015F9696|nr:acyl-CoA dehydrogenase family protein [Salisediminibacterium selenitireducens]
MAFLNPKQLDLSGMDEQTAAVMKNTVDFFERMGISKIKEEDERGDWYPAYTSFIRDSGAYATFLTPEVYGDGTSRFDLARACNYSELTAFYGLSYQYAYQVSLLGLSPIWMSANEDVKKRAGKALRDGGIFAFGMSEKEHGADLYANEMTLEPQSDGTYLVNGAKYYIGNANEAALVSVFGRMKDTGDFVFFVVEPDHPSYELNKKIHTSGVRPAYVGEFTLKNYPITDADILSTGKEAWDASLSTVNIGKFQLGFASAGICQHAFYESLSHAANRELYGMKVTDFSHVQDLFIENYCRIHGMRMFATRAVGRLPPFIGRRPTLPAV